MKTGRKPGSERISTFKATKEGTLFDFLQQVFKEKSKTSIKQLLANKLVQVDNQYQTHVSFALKPGNSIVVGKKELKQAKIPFSLNILFEDDYLMAVLKPEGLLCNATEKEKLQFILENVETIIDRDYKLAEITNIDFTSYSEPYFIVIENLIAMHYGEEITSAIMFYLYGNKDDDGNEFPYDEAQEGNQTFIRTFEDLWAIVGQRFSQN